MTASKIDFESIETLKELHQVLKSKKIRLEAECTHESYGKPITYVRKNTKSQSDLTKQALSFLRKSPVPKLIREFNSEHSIKKSYLLTDYKEYREDYNLHMLVEDDIQAGVASNFRRKKSAFAHIQKIKLLPKLDLTICLPDLNKALEGYIKPNFSAAQIATCVKELQASAIDLFSFDKELKPSLLEYDIEEGLSLKEELRNCKDMAHSTRIYSQKTHKILMRPIVDFIMNHFAELEFWEISHDTTYFAIGRPDFFIGIFGYTHDGKFDGVVYKGYNEI